MGDVDRWGRVCLPGDSHGRGSFDTSARFVAGRTGRRPWGDEGLRSMYVL